MMLKRAALVVCAVLFAFTGSVAPASAEPTWPVNSQVLHGITGRCLVADYNAVYTFSPPCPSNQRWTLIAAGPGNRLRNDATNQCLANLDYNRVYMTSCSSTEPGVWWSIFTETAVVFRLYNNNTRRMLSSDYSNSVYLADYVDNQTWVRQR